MPLTLRYAELPLGWPPVLDGSSFKPSSLSVWTSSRWLPPADPHSIHLPLVKYVRNEDVAAGMKRVLGDMFDDMPYERPELLLVALCHTLGPGGYIGFGALRAGLREGDPHEFGLDCPSWFEPVQTMAFPSSASMSRSVPLPPTVYERLLKD